MLSVKNELLSVKNELSSVKSELSSFKGDIKTELTAVKGDIKTELTSNFIQELRANDQKLRTDLHSFLMGVQTNVKMDLRNLNEELLSALKGVFLQIEDLNLKRLPDLATLISDTNNKVNDIFFENELIKHQLNLDEEIRRYNTDLDSLKIVIADATRVIENEIKNEN